MGEALLQVCPLVAPGWFVEEGLLLQEEGMYWSEELRKMIGLVRC
jgi:hypothetical protein